jgi:hypothetical protein
MQHILLRYPLPKIIVMKKIICLIIGCCWFSLLSAQSKISAAEYFIDTDPGFGKATSIPISTPSSNIVNKSFNITISGLAEGIHKLYLRSRNDSGRWSITGWVVFYKPSADVSPSASNIVKAEYFFDTDPGFGKATNIPVTAAVNLQNINVAAGIDTLITGMHSLFIRSKNTNGTWSITNRVPFYKQSSIAGQPPSNITQVEYFIDTDPGFGNAVPVVVNAAANFSDFVVPVNISGLAVGDHNLYVRSKNVNGAWSISNVYTFQVAAVASSPYINVNAITKKVMCSKDSLKISFDARGTYNAGNVFNVQLSDSSGSFASPIVIGSYTGTKSAIIACKLPNNVVGGIHFRLRVNSSNPAVTGLTGRDTLIIGNRSLSKIITGPVNVNGTMSYVYNVPAVTGSIWNWMITGGIQQSGNNISVAWTKPSGVNRQIKVD